MQEGSQGKGEREQRKHQAKIIPDDSLNDHEFSVFMKGQ